jgi:MYXO-CTERM domain-containing protein
LTRRAGALDALTSTLFFGGITWPAWPVIGAGLGAALRRRRSMAQ